MQGDEAVNPRVRVIHGTVENVELDISCFKRKKKLEEQEKQLNPEFYSLVFLPGGRLIFRHDKILG